MSLSYERIEEQLLERLPELQPVVETYWRMEGTPGEDSGAYILFDNVVETYVTVLLATPPSIRRDALVKRAFDLAEEMLGSGRDLHDLAGIAFFEGQTSRWFELALPFLGPRCRSQMEQEQPAQKSSVGEVIDLYGVRPLVANLLADEGVRLSDLVGSTTLIAHTGESPRDEVPRV